MLSIDIPPPPALNTLKKIDYSVGQKGWLNVVHAALFFVLWKWMEMETIQHWEGQPKKYPKNEDRIFFSF